MIVRLLRDDDHAGLLPLVLRLWPDAGDFEFADDLTLVVEEGCVLAGFAIVTVRPFSNACQERPAPHLEGWYVEPGFRRRGVGRALVAACEDWCRARGFTELGSDVLLENAASLDAHERLGFEAVEKVQYFRKSI